MSYNTYAKLPLKVMINKQKSKVLFAEANSDFINVLLSFLAMPLGKIVENYIPLGSLNTLNSSLSNLDQSYFSTRGAKQMLLNPQSSFRAECRKLAIDITASNPSRYFVCEDGDCTKSGFRNVSMYSDIATCECGKSLNRSVSVEERLDVGVFTISPLSFVVTDDLRVAPIVSGVIQTLNSLGITETEGAELMRLSFDADEIKKLLNLCLTSTTPFTDMIFAKTGVISTAAKPEPGILLHHIQKSDANPRKMALKICLQKSTNKFLFAEAMDEFVEFLCSFLTLPLAGVEFLLGGKTGLKNIDNLYTSLSNGIDAKYFTTSDMKSRLINPKLPHGYRSEYPFLPLSEDGPPKLFYKEEMIKCHRYSKILKPERTYFHHSQKDVYNLQVCLQKSTIKFLYAEAIFDDFMEFLYGFIHLPLAALEFLLSGNTGVHSLDSLYRSVSPGIEDKYFTSPEAKMPYGFDSEQSLPLSDVKERELGVGIEEGLGILKASLTSKTALTDAIIEPMHVETRELTTVFLNIMSVKGVAEVKQKISNFPI
ncbi:uncharacterized protein LOC131009993 [Salvia miltiorrhiza]|uniref:uncharacterized protein LOC131009993 n=1 Tax=Salvia miltiorrhiza TaxID=226208 RepID=UPI0025AB825A|nr:uncharacterized protein LOC131009993 [Salvia miltiorrhiza]